MRKGIRSLLALWLCLAMCLGTATVASADFIKFYSRSTISNLRVRNGATMSAGIQDHLKKDQLIWVLSEAYVGDVRFYEVEYVDPNKTRRTGWVVSYDSSGGYLYDLTVDDQNALPYKDGALPLDWSDGKSTSSGASNPDGTTSAGSSPAAATAAPSGSSSGGSSASTDVAEKYKNTYLKLGSKGSAVKEMQQKLKDLKMYSGDVTGTFGSLTQDAVKAFQKKQGLYQDGVAGPSTLTALFGGGSSSSGSSSSGSSTNTGTDASDLGYTTKDKVNFRSGAGTSYASKSLLGKGQVFTILSKSTVSGYTWYYGEVSGSKGYIRNDMMAVMTAAEAANYRAGGSMATATPAPTLAPGATATPAPSGTTSGMARITASNVNVRSGATSKSTSYGKAARNDVFEIQNSQTADGVVWYYLKGSKLTGWVHGSYVHVMTQAEIDEYNKTSGSSSGTSGSGTNTTYTTLKVGSKGTAVSNLQAALKTQGFYSGAVSGSFGTLTETAVKAFQRKNGLYVDGIAGQNTQALLYGTGGSSSGGTPADTPTIQNVQMPKWSDFKAGPGNDTNWPRSNQSYKATVTDVDTRKSFYIVKQSAGNHLDVEPASANDTAVLTAIYGGKIDYVRRAVWVTYNGVVYAGSMYAVPHGNSTVSGNNFEGQFCIHMYQSMNHVAGAVDADHQKMVDKAYKIGNGLSYP